MNKNKPYYIIGETAYNHEGDIKYLFKMIDDIKEIGLNAVKFHLLIDPASYMQRNHPVIAELKKWIFNEDEWDKIINHSISNNLDIIALCDDVESVEYLLKKKHKIKAIELHATGINDYYLLNAVSQFDGDIFLGVGGTTVEEIIYAVDFLKGKIKGNIVLMYGFQSYPTNYADINFSRMIKLRDLFNLQIGYADHTGFDDPNNEFISSIPAAMGFNILEKHYTPDYGVQRIDYHSAVGKEKMLKIKNLMEIGVKLYGNNSLSMSSPELKYGNTGPMKKAVVAKKKIMKGEKITFENTWFKRTKEESVMKQNQFLQIIDSTANSVIEEDEIIDFSKIVYSFKEVSLESFTNIKEEKK